jgi:hypothetical protein
MSRSVPSTDGLSKDFGKSGSEFSPEGLTGPDGASRAVGRATRRLRRGPSGLWVVGRLVVAESKMDHEILPLAGDQSRLAASAAAGDQARRCWLLKTRSLRMRVRSHADDLDAEAGERDLSLLTSQDNVLMGEAFRLLRGFGLWVPGCGSLNN